MQRERLRFPGATGARLVARLQRPDGPAAGHALFAHCFTCSKDLKAVRRIAEGLVAEGIAVLSFDFTGIGESEGDFADTDFASNLDDLVAAAEFMEREVGAPRILVGHSLGGAAVLAAARRIPAARALVTLAAPSEPGYLAAKIEEIAPEITGRGESEVTLGERRFRVRRELLDDLREHRLRAALAELGRPLLVLHSPADRIVGIDHARRIFESARHPKSFISLDGADHLLLRDPRDAAFVARVLAAWASRYVGAAGPRAGREERRAGGRPEESALPAGEVLVEGGASGLANRVRAGRHRLAADEPESVPGGGDTGPDPYAYLLAGLGACKSMTVRMYADRKDWALSGVRVRLRHERVHARDCEDCETREGKIDVIDCELGLDGELDDEQRRRLVEIADRCPVHRTLESETRIRTRRAG